MKTALSVNQKNDTYIHYRMLYIQRKADEVLAGVFLKGLTWENHIWEGAQTVEYGKRLLNLSQ